MVRLKADPTLVHLKVDPTLVHLKVDPHQLRSIAFSNASARSRMPS